MTNTTKPYEFKRSNRVIKTCLKQTQDTKFFKKLFLNAHKITTDYKAFTQARIVDSQGRTFVLLHNPKTKDFIINIVTEGYITHRYSNKKALLR